MGSRTRAASWARLRSASWTTDGTVKSAVMKGNCAIQGIDQGVGGYNFDEYYVVIEAFPTGMTAGSFMVMFGNQLNDVVASRQFWLMNEFTRRSSSAKLRVGDIYDINILGPFNGSVMLVAISPGFGSPGQDSHWFIFQTIVTAWAHSHPECGAREFGVEKLGREYIFYTRGCSRPADRLMLHTASRPQQASWLGLMAGIAAGINKAGGRARADSVQFLKEGRAA